MNSSDQPSRSRVLFLLIATGTLLGLSTNMAKIAANANLAPSAFLAWSGLIAGCALLAMTMIRRNALRWTGVSLRYAVFSAALSLALPNLLFFSAVPHVGASFVALCITFPPLFTYLGALLLRLERPDAWRIAGVALALTGAAYIALLKLNVPDAPIVWIGAALIGPVILAAGNLYRTVAWPPGVRPDQLAPGLLIAAAGLVALASLILGLSLTIKGPMQAGLIVAQAAIFAAQFSLLFQLQRHGGPVYLSLLGAVAAITGVPFAFSVLGESSPPGLLLGGILIAAGVVVLTLHSTQRPR